ncbi:MAG TPA: glycosyltransferase family 9 protein [Acidimicrobiales bacterium]|nr:glycosyltransferase family 9 protein [Acidimicrobiales bacterium]
MLSRRVLVVRLDNAGDVLLSGPAVRAVAAAGADITYLCGPHGRAAARLLPGVGAVIEHRAPWIDPDRVPVDRGTTEEVIAAVEAVAPDEAVILTSFHQSPLPTALLLKLAGVPMVAAISEDYPGSLLDVRHRVDDDIHEVQRSLSLVGRLGYRLPDGDDDRLRVVLPSRSSPLGGGDDGLLAGGAFVVLHPGASVSARAWGPARAQELAAALAARGTPVVVTGGGAEQGLTAAVAAAARSAATAGTAVVDAGGRTDLTGLAVVIARARAVVTGNTGPAHLAAAVGTPVVSLYAPTVPAVRWRPWRVPHVLLGDQRIACAGCRARICPVEGHPCLSSVTLEEVLDGLDAVAGAGVAA